ncbi:MAG: prepilin peptidase [Roseateles depolymerans]|uniref:Prepilin peptidase n=1 Tax=Roseateles depolymerans TaxID=76731 RepID=A0A2W5DWJ8_9BURK|nr:MAG: prepilin peptidase [Roseateles depolymerans]
MSTQDLTDAEFAELDELLAQTPEPLNPLDASMLDGYLCGVIVQPRLIEIDEWLPNIFDYDGGVLPDAVDTAWLDRITELVQRRHAALNRGLVEDGWFDPVVLDMDDDAQPEPLPDDASDEEREQRAVYDALGPISRVLMPWVAGFQHAALCFPELAELPNDDVATALARLYRHLPAETPEEKEVVATLDREHPLKDLDDAIEELVVTVADIADLTEAERYRVDTIRRDQPKVGRNDPCPCGSGKKYKACHGSN